MDAVVVVVGDIDVDDGDVLLGDEAPATSGFLWMLADEAMTKIRSKRRIINCHGVFIRTFFSGCGSIRQRHPGLSFPRAHGNEERL